MKSMTGFGRGEATSSSFRCEVEVASVNRKQAEVNLSLPRGLSELEAPLRKQALGAVSRGRLSISIKLNPLESTGLGLAVDPSRVESWRATLKELSSLLGQDLPLTASDVLRHPDHFLSESTLSAQTLLPLITDALTSALADLISMRLQEGQHLASDLQERIQALRTLTNSIANRSPHVPKRQRELLFQRLKEAGLELELSDERVLREIGLFADRCDISEELTRLASHFEKFENLIASKDPSGRPMDFLCQELNREFNTIASKANDAELAHLIVSAKTELEKAREQVQNIE